MSCGERRGAGEQPMIGAMLHSLAFGATLHYVTDDPKRKELSRKQMEMTAEIAKDFLDILKQPGSK